MVTFLIIVLLVAVAVAFSKVSRQGADLRALRTEVSSLQERLVRLQQRVALELAPEKPQTSLQPAAVESARTTEPTPQSVVPAAEDTQTPAQPLPTPDPASLDFSEQQLSAYGQQELETLAGIMERLDSDAITSDQVRPIAQTIARKIGYAGMAADQEPERFLRAFAKQAFNRQLEAGLSASTPAPVVPTAQVSTSAPTGIDRMMSQVRALLFGGNTVVRVGIFIFLVGIVLLLKWAVDRELLSIELRMAGAALLSSALIAVGFWQRETRREFGMTLQGGGVSALYLVVFFAFRSYSLLPVPLAFGLLVSIALFSGAMAVLQDSLALIVIGTIGGFLAPILASTGQGNHVVLFSYYLLLNVLIAAVAFFKTWRPLNLLGFLFTFGIATTWGALRYEPALFNTVEPFLIAYFLLYVSIVVTYASRHPWSLKATVDGTLAFGTPLVVILLQYALVHDRPFGMAYSALGMSVVYIGLGWFLHRRSPGMMRDLTEVFLAIGVGFVTLAIPFAFSDHSLTGATWAIEGAGLFWLGIRQDKPTSRHAGWLLQLGAGLAVLWSSINHGSVSESPLVGTFFLGAAAITFGSLVVAYLAAKHEAIVGKTLTRRLNIYLLAYGLLWWLWAVADQVPHDYDVAAFMIAVAASALVLDYVAGALNWAQGRRPVLFLPLGIAPLMLSNDLDTSHPTALCFRDNPLAAGGILAWPFYIGATYFKLWTRADTVVAKRWHWTYVLAALSVAAFNALLLSHLVGVSAELAGTWPTVAFAAGVVLSVFLVLSFTDVLETRNAKLASTHRVSVLLPLIATIAVWFAFANLGEAGDPSPLPYIPLLNPLDIAFAFCALASAFALTRVHAKAPFEPPTKRTLQAVMAAAVFLWFNGLLARTVHHYGGVPFEPDALWDSVALQVAVTVSWTVIALSMMVVAHRRGLRIIWFVGAAFIAAVVFKLFFVDLANLSTVAKIGTFLVVGLLLLLVGFLAPVPPAREGDTPGKDDVI